MALLLSSYCYHSDGMSRAHCLPTQQSKAGEHEATGAQRLAIPGSMCVLGGGDEVLKHLCLPIAMNKVMSINKNCNHNYAYVPEKNRDAHIL